MDSMLKPQARRTLLQRPRQRLPVLVGLTLLILSLFSFRHSSPQLRILPYLTRPYSPLDGAAPLDQAASSATPHSEGPTSSTRPEWDVDIEDLRHWIDPDDHEDPKDVLPGSEEDGTVRDPPAVSKLQHEKDLRKIWRYAYKTTAFLKSSNLIYGNTLNTLTNKEERTQEQEKVLREDADAKVEYTAEKAVRLNPYPSYNSWEWAAEGHASHVPCSGPGGKALDDLLVFKGRPALRPAPKLGSYDALGLDPNICWERETRLGPYGFTPPDAEARTEVNWQTVRWGDLQRKCLELNADRFNPTRGAKDAGPTASSQIKRWTASRREAFPEANVTEQRTAILLRSYTGVGYADDDLQVIRAMIVELSLRTGGQYEVFLLVHSRDPGLHIFEDQALYDKVLRDNVPPELHDITVLWNDEQIRDVYTELRDDRERSVHMAQWLSVQHFSLNHPQFDFIWNWEMDVRVIGHHFDLLDKMSKFAKKQPRKYLWERNGQWYIPEHHGDYDTTFRHDVAERFGQDSVWGPLEQPFIHPAGPRPPVPSPDQDDYEWGVGEDADLITLGPMFDPIDSQWILAPEVWGYDDADHRAQDLPRRATIVTHSRLSKRLLKAMHDDNMRGSHVASEMTPQTVALLHGFKAVFAPHPVLMDRDWRGDFLNKWFNPGPKGQAGGRGSPMGWGRERRYQGTTWYYRAEPPNRLYNNWMGWPDTGIGGRQWEEQHGRPCLPSLILHPIKDTQPTAPDHKTGFDILGS